MIFRWHLYPCWWETVQKICPSHLVANLNLYICSVCYEAADTLYTTIEKLSDPFRLPLFNIIMMIRWHLHSSWWKTVQTICPRHLVANLKLYICSVCYEVVITLYTYYYREIAWSISASAIQYCYDFMMAFIPLLVKNCPKNMPKSFGCKFEFVYLFSMLWSGRHAIYYYREIERSISASVI